MGPLHRTIVVLALACSGCEGPSWYVPGPVRGDDAGSPVPRDAAEARAIDAGPPDAPLDAPRCEPETCNGEDDDCDGMIDDGAACPCEVRVLGGRTYLFCGELRTWDDARATCVGAGYELVAISSAVEDANVYGELAARAWADTWIGLGDAATEGTFRWSNGDPLAYAHWDEGEPNDGGGAGEDCAVVMTVAGRETLWDDRGCTTARPHVCEAPDPP